jgi:hypothetical protein
VDRARLLAEVDRVMSGSTVEEVLRKKVRRTLLVLSVLALKWDDQKGTWKRARQKAVRFVMDAMAIEGDEVDRWVREVVGRTKM